MTETIYINKILEQLIGQIRQARDSGEKIAAFHVPKELANAALLWAGGLGKMLRMDWSASDDLVQFWIFFP